MLITELLTLIEGKMSDRIEDFLDDLSDALDGVSLLYDYHEEDIIEVKGDDDIHSMVLRGQFTKLPVKITAWEVTNNNFDEKSGTIDVELNSAGAKTLAKAIKDSKII